MSIYELWHIASSNLLGSFDSEEPALELVRELVATNGPTIADALELGVEDDNGHFAHLGTGPQLIARAETRLRVA